MTVSLSALDAIADGFRARADEEFSLRMEAWPIDLTQEAIRQGIGGLLARQLTLASQIALSPGIWNGHAAPVFLRAMADVFINLAWLVLDPSDRCKKFVQYGLGQKKLELEHRRTLVASGDLPPEIGPELDAFEREIESQRSMLLLDVDLGSWSGLSVREMARESGCLDFYNLVYMPFSACTHSTWGHLASYNVRLGRNPLHKVHFEPVAPEWSIDPHYLFLAGKYLQKTATKFDSWRCTAPTNSGAAFRFLCGELDRLGESQGQGTEVSS